LNGPLPRENVRGAQTPPGYSFGGVAANPLDIHQDKTRIGLVKTMTISYFKAHISEELRKVRKGARILIRDRDTPIAEVVPYRAEPPILNVRQPRLTPFTVPRPTFKIDHDPVDYLLEDRETR
jgi:antitoxin (DNA-binding transcriptional repressor) of toxin-antitoxin stability system